MSAGTESTGNAKGGSIAKSIVLSGGGVKGIIHLGCLYYLHLNGYLNFDDVKEYSGTSIGAAICLLLAVGYTPMEIFNNLGEVGGIFSIHDVDLWNAVKHTGIISIEKFSGIIEGLVMKKIPGDHPPTFQELCLQTGATLNISVVNLSEGIEVKCSPTTTPDMLTLEAVKMSCTIPFIFQKVKYGTNVVVDGGLVNNFPIDYTEVSPREVLGICISTELDYVDAESGLGVAWKLVNLPIDKISFLKIQARSESTVINIKDKSGVLLALTHENKMKLFVKGMAEAERKMNSIKIYIDGWDSP